MFAAKAASAFGAGELVDALADGVAEVIATGSSFGKTVGGTPFGTAGPAAANMSCAL
jgi:hypothetical protein